MSLTLLKYMCFYFTVLNHERISAFPKNIALVDSETMKTERAVYKYLIINVETILFFNPN